MLLLLLSRFSHVRLCATPQMAAHQAPLSLGFSRQEFWSGLLFPSPTHACMLTRFIHVRLCATPWTAVHHAPLSTGFSRQEYWSELPFPSLSRHEGMPTQKKWREERPLAQFWLLFLYVFVSSPLACPMHIGLGQECWDFYLKSSLWSSDLPLFYFRRLFPSLSFSHHHSGLLFPILTV